MVEVIGWSPSLNPFSLIPTPECAMSCPLVTPHTVTKTCSVYNMCSAAE